MRFATQPIEDFHCGQQLETLVGQMESLYELLCFSTDYPHWDFDSPLEALPTDLDPGLTNKNSFMRTHPLFIRRLPAPARA